jgi:hypothetical protein
MIRFIGDIHGKKKEYLELLPNEYPSIQLGDYGMGFSGLKSPVDLILPSNAYFIRGNHDNPEVCKRHPNYLGDFGCKEIDGRKIFFVSGAWSIDWMYRREGISWWPNEELSPSEMNVVYDMYCDEKPELVISHDAPKEICTQLLPWGGKLHGNATETLFSAMFAEWKPKNWVFGHWHTTQQITLSGTDFQCLDELDYLDF